MNSAGGAAEDTTVHRPAEESSAVGGPVAAAAQQLAPGTLLGDRYRIVSLLGRGGMGEVYRADDLRLGQPVALKFLSQRAGEERRLYDEVRIGRQVSHPNVCRLHDIAEVNGQFFITMEFVDGEDLASLLRRVGRLPAERGLAIAREICSGLAAAHDKGVIHRDLKPGNVMIDGRGHARITDFGLAVSEGRGLQVSAGTPAYMAPEQLGGAPASVQSDVYALGLTMYELFTGKRAFAATSIHELMERQLALDITRPTSLVRELDPAVERVITHCLDPIPGKRPRSARDVRNELPGGDALAAAVGAGETPSPAMVAAAAERGDLSARSAWVALALFAVALLAFAFVAPRATLHGRVHVFKPAPILEERARQVLVAAGHRLAVADTAYLYLADLPQTEWTKKRHRPTGLDAMPIRFLYRQSPMPMRSLTLEQRVDSNNPPLSISGMASVQLDSAGKLTELVVVPPQLEDAPAARRNVNWAPLLAMAGLPRALREVPPRWAAPVDSDQKAAWVTAEGDVRVEAAAYHGKPVWFAVIPPWNSPARMPPTEAKRLFISDFAFFAALVIAWMTAGLLGLRNLRRARVDMRGALRVALFVFVTCALSLALRAHHPGGLREFPIIGKLLAYALTLGAGTWFAYVAIEPLVRRRWPGMLIGWSRLLSGQFRDPMIGRDLLLGSIAGIVLELTRAINSVMAGASPLLIAPSSFGYLSDTAHYILRNAFTAAFLPLLAVTILLAALVATRNLTAALMVGGIILAAGALDSFHGPQWIRIPSAIFAAALTIALMFRLGVLAVAASTFVALTLMRLPITVDTTDWYFGRSLLGILLLVTVAVYGFITSLGGKRFLPDLAIES